MNFLNSVRDEVRGVLIFIIAVAVLSVVAYGVSAIGSRSGSKSAIVVTEGTAESGETMQDESASSGESSAETSATVITTAAETTAAPATGAAADSSSVVAGQVVNEYGVAFTITADEQVTAIEETNLRSVPSTESDDTIVTKLFNGDIVVRDGVSENGWSRIIYNGQIVYAATNLLTTPAAAVQ